MKVIERRKLPGMALHDTAAALGAFDAMHKGHLAVIRRAVDYAAKHDLRSVVYLFRMPPRIFFGGDQKCVYPLEKRLQILDGLSVDIAVVEDFDAEYAKTSCGAFVEFLKRVLGTKAVFAGFNYRFGANGAGDGAMLQKLCAQHRIVCEIVSCVSENGRISSSRIRDLIEHGAMEEAEKILGRPFSVSGKVVKGNQIGRTMGFPTANMEIPAGLVVPKDGVYVSRVAWKGKTYPAITNVGGKPTVTSVGRNIETHILGLSADLYGRELEVEFLSYLRDIVKFDSLDRLKAQLESDKAKASAVKTISRQP